VGIIEWCIVRRGCIGCTFRKVGRRRRERRLAADLANRHHE
jgi:hypothetical protein